MDNYFIIHGSFGSPFGNWFSWLHDLIEDDGKQVYVPDFPIGVGYQNYENWSKLLKYYLDLGLINENTTIIGHSIAPIFISKFLVENKVKVKKLIFVCGFNNYLGINEEYDNVNKSMYFDNLEDVKQFADEIICFYSDNDPYVKKDKLYKIGITEMKTPYGNKVKVYDLERTICDIIRNKKKIEIALFTDAMKRYADRKDRNSIKLHKYAKIFNIEDELRKYLEVLL